QSGQPGVDCDRGYPVHASTGGTGEQFDGGEASQLAIPVGISLAGFGMFIALMLNVSAVRREKINQQ
ncbi:hypothetical protein, partial [Rhodococcus sp. BH5]|uniref:hypothetical protein n=1 Tax=Rhodococcus sp. BH5 TaxID=2871702 RepID=UPI0022CD81F6